MIEHTVTNSKDEVSREIGFHHYLARLSQNPSLIIMDFADNLPGYWYSNPYDKFKRGCDLPE